MKKFAIILVLFFFLLAIGDGVIQTPWAKRKLISSIEKNLRDSGWSIKIAQIKRAFPDIDLEGVNLSSPDFELKFGTLQADISLSRLWKKEISFLKLIADDVSWELKKEKETEFERKSASNPPSFRLSIKEFSLTNANLFENFSSAINGTFSIKQTRKRGIQIQAKGSLLPHWENPFLQREWEFSGKLSQLKNGSWDIEKLSVSSDIGTVKGSGILTSQGRINAATLDLDSKTYGDLSLKSKLQETPEGLKIETDYRIHSLYGVTNVKGEISSLYADKKVISSSQMTGLYLNTSWNMNAPFTYTTEKGLLFTEAKIDSEIIKLQGDVSLKPNMELLATGIFNSGNVHAVYPRAYGDASGEFSLQIEEVETSLYLKSEIDNAYFETIFAKKLAIDSNLKNPFSEITGTATCRISGGKWQQLEIEEARIETAKEGENWPFSINCNGQWGHTLDMSANGFWAFDKKSFLVSLQNVDGSFYNQPLLLQQPVTILSSNQSFQVGDFSILTGGARLEGFFSKEADGGKALLKIDSLPIDFISLNPLDIDVGGTLNLELSISEEGNNLKGKIHSNLENLSLQLLDEEVVAKASIDGSFDRNELKLKGDLQTTGEPLAKFDLNLPIHFELFPPLLDPYLQRQIQGSLFFKGRIEEVLDFFDLKSHRLEGMGACNLSLSGTLNQPILEGICSIENGFYQNYYTGTELKNIEARFDAEENVLVLESFRATDAEEKGRVLGNGKIHLLPDKLFPFEFTISLLNMNLNTFDLIQTEGSGTIQISGNLSSSTAKGEIEVVKSDISIPKKIPKEVPDIQVTYINEKAPLVQFQPPQKKTHLLNLDIEVTAPDQIILSGRGLESEWKGQFRVQGEQPNIVTEGKIELIKGEFIFSGRTFKLTEGSMKFPREVHATPLISLSADVQVKDIQITASLKGPLNNPQVTLHSFPPLPIGSIMSYLLFGEELAEINSFQALQLANSVASLASGDTPSLIETTKKSVGIDRFEIISIPDASPDGDEKIGIQVGKYITDGVLVSLSQGADNSSTNIRIEVDLRGNLSLILESDQANEQKQGKLSFRWAYTY